MARDSCGRMSFVDAPEAIESVRLGIEGRSRRQRCLALQGEMHPLVAHVLLRLAGVDALDSDAKFHPPGRQPRKTRRSSGGDERLAIVAADGLRNPVPTEELLEDLAGGCALGSAQWEQASRNRDAASTPSVDRR